MTRVDFMRRLHEQARPGLSESSLEFAARQCQRDGRMAEQDVTPCLKFATVRRGILDFPPGERDFWRERGARRRRGPPPHTAAHQG